MKKQRLLVGALALGLSVATAAPGIAASKTTAKKKTTTKKTTATTKAPTASAVSTPATNAPASTSAAAKPEFKVMVVGDFTSAIGFPVSETVAAAKAGLKDVPNARVITCDSKTDPNAAQGCARDAVSQNVAAVILAFSPLAQDLSVLTRAGIPVIGQADLVSPNSFTFANGTAQYTGMGAGFVKSGCRALGVLYFEGTDVLVDAIHAGAKSLGGGVVNKAAIDPRNPDFAPAVAKLTGALDCVALSVAPPMIPAAVLAIVQSGDKVRMGGVGAIFPAQIIRALGSNAEGILVFEGQLNADDPNAEVLKTMRTDMVGFDKDARITQQAIITWSSARAVSKAANSINGPIDAKTLQTALAGLRSLNLDGAMAPLDLDGQKSPKYARLVNPSLAVYAIKGGAPVKTIDFFNYSSALS